MLNLAIDLGMSKSVFCQLDTQTGECSFGGRATRAAEFRALFEQRRPELVVVEACSLAALVWDVAGEVGAPIVVADTTQDAWRWKNVKRKTDRDDALKLARRKRRKIAIVAVMRRRLIVAWAMLRDPTPYRPRAAPAAAAA